MIKISTVHGPSLLFFLRDHKFEVVSQTRDYFTTEISDAALTHDVQVTFILNYAGTPTRVLRLTLPVLLLRQRVEIQYLQLLLPLVYATSLYIYVCRNSHHSLTHSCYPPYHDFT